MSEDRLLRHCLLCANGRIPAGEVLLCDAGEHTVRCSHARSDGGACGPDGVMFIKKPTEVRNADS